MCSLCQTADLSLDAYYAALAAKIDAHGWAVQGVIGDRVRAPFAYTVGLTLFGCPELVVTGLRYERACALLNQVAEHSLRDTPPRPGERLRLDHGPQLEVVKLDHPDAHLFTAVALYGPDILALQLVWADGPGRWPWERGHRGGRGGQPVLGPRAGAAPDAETTPMTCGLTDGHRRRRQEFPGATGRGR